MKRPFLVPNPDGLFSTCSTVQNIVILRPRGSADEVEINAALDAISADGGAVLLAPGTFVINHPVRAYEKDKIALCALVDGATTMQVSATYTSTSIDGTSLTGAITFAGCSDFEISGIVVDGQTNNIQANGIECRPIGADIDGTPCSNYAVHANTIKVKTGAHNYSIWNLKADNGSVYNNLIDGGETTFASFTEQEGIETVGGTNMKVYGNTVRNLGGSAIQFGGLLGVTAMSQSNVVAFGNIIEDCWFGCTIESGNDPAYGPAHIDGLNIYGNDIVARKYGLFLSYTSGDAADPQRIANFRFSGNTIRMAGSGLQGVRPINLTNQSATSLGDVTWDNAEISHNVCFGNPGTDAASIMAYCAVAEHVRFTNNQFFCDPAAPCKGTAMYLLGCNDMTVHKNTVDGCTGSALEVPTTANVEVSANDFRNYALGGTALSAVVFAASCSNIRERDNRFSTTAYATAGVPVRFDFGMDGLSYGGSEYIGGNWTGNVYTENGGTIANGSRGSVTASGGLSSFTVTTSRCRATSTVDVTQYSGAIVARTSVTPANGSFVFTIASANNGAVYRWRIFE